MSLYSAVLRKTILPALLDREGQRSALAHWRLLDESQYWPEQRLLDYQWQKFKVLLQSAYDNTVYYRQVLQERGLTPDSFRDVSDITKLPILTREITFERSNDLLSRAFKPNEIMKFASGGTTGQQAFLFRDKESFNIKLALGWRHESFMGRRPCDKMAHIWPAVMDFHATITRKTHLKDRYLMRQIMYQAGSFNDPAMRSIHADMLKYRPDYLKAFPSALTGLVDFCIEHDLKLPHVKGVMSTGEVLYDRQRRLFEQAFDSPVFDMYGSRETGNTSCECEMHNGRHIAMETSLVEFVNDNKPVGHGETGEILITDLTNFAFPLIRYRINDYGVPLDKTCKCGRTLKLMSSAVGRVQDDIYSADGTRLSGLTFSVHLLTAFDRPIGQLQVVQKSYSDFLVRIKNKPEPTRETMDFIRSQMHKFLGDSINIDIQVVEEIPHEKSGKTRFVICEVPARQ